MLFHTCPELCVLICVVAQALVSLLKGERFGSLDSVIVYCTRREETSRIAALLRTCMQGVMLRESSKPAPEDDDNPVGKRKKALGNSLSRVHKKVTTS